MALIVEDGSGLRDAESYISVAGATAYHVARGHDVWTDAGADEQEPALRRATEWIDASFRDLFVGLRKGGRTQGLEWPRIGAYITMVDNGIRMSPSWRGFSIMISENEIPKEIERATSEAALREITNPGVLYTDVVPGQIIKSVSVSGAVSVTYADGSAKGQQTLIPIIGAIISPLLILSGSSSSSMFGLSDRSN
jgi:hypothetical protein